MRRIEALEKLGLENQIQKQNPDELFSLNQTQQQIDHIKALFDSLQERFANLENLTSDLIAKQGDKSTVELKKQMSDLKNKFSFLEPQPEANAQSVAT